MIRLLSLVLVFMLCLSGSAHAYTPGDYGEITGIYANASGEYPGGYLVAHIINGNGMEEFGPSTHHIVPPGFMWLSSGTDPAAQWVEFDLQDVYNLTEVRIWNYNERIYYTDQLPEDWTKGRGVYNMDILVAGADHIFTPFSNVNLNKAGGGYPVFDTVALVADEIQYVKFDINSNLASLYPEISQSYVGLSEVMFYPEPATMMLLGLGAVGLLRRRRA